MFFDGLLLSLYALAMLRVQQLAGGATLASFARRSIIRRGRDLA